MMMMRPAARFTSSAMRGILFTASDCWPEVRIRSQPNSNQLLQCGKGIAANIKDAMTGDEQRFGRLDQPASKGHRYHVFRQATKDRRPPSTACTVRYPATSTESLPAYREVASTRTDNHIYIDRRSECLRRPDLPVAGCRSSFRDAGTKFHTFCTSGFCFHTAFVQVCTNFDNTSGFIRILPLLFLLHKDKTIMRNYPIFPRKEIELHRHPSSKRMPVCINSVTYKPNKTQNLADLFWQIWQIFYFCTPKTNRLS